MAVLLNVYAQLISLIPIHFQLLLNAVFRRKKAVHRRRRLRSI
jgi:hypothetical protein